MKNLFFLLCLWSVSSHAQRKWIESGTIEYQVKTSRDPAISPTVFVAPITTNYFTCYFSDNRSLYVASEAGIHTDAAFNAIDKEKSWFNDHTGGIATKTIPYGGEVKNISGKQLPIQWKIFPDEIMDIAGFKCRKAQAILFDSVYVFAYYTDEITISSGPMNLHGLPGMILGVTIPRMRTSWIATSVSVRIPESVKIQPWKKGKKISLDEMLNDINKSAATSPFHHQNLWSVQL